MPRYALRIEYNGAAFAGWQRQADQPSVQGAIEAALARLEPGPHVIAAAGRTDAGVHATGQVAHADLTRDWGGFKLAEALNFHLRPAAVAVVAAVEVPGDFHARFSAVERSYTYRILCRRAHPVLDAGQVWRVGYPLDVAAMREGAAHLVGRHDFTTFRSSQCQANSPIRTLDRLDVTRLGDEIEIRASARSFLHNQVRSMVGSLKRVGDGAWTSADLGAALEAANRAACGQVAPPDGLYLTGVDYPDG